VDLLDVVILIAAVAYAVGGYRNGAVVGLFSLAGFLGGAVAGAQLGRPLGSAIAHGQGQVVVALLTVLVVALVGQLAMVFVARLLRSHITWRSAQAVDSGIGALLGVVSVLLVAWMVAVPLASSPYPTLASQARHSSIVSKVDDAVPGDLRQVYSSLRNYIDRSGFPQVFNDLQPTHITDVNPPDAALLNAPGVVADKASVLKIYGTAVSCSRAIEGSGFVYAPGLVVTNAHVVAGTDRVTVQVSPLENLSAQVVVYDPETDVAVLRVAGLKATPLKFAPKAAVSGDNAIVLGYPENGPFTADAARIRDQQQIVGPDIYNQQQVKRQIYAIRGTVRSGNSGGPLIAPDGTVLGIVFATALDSSNTGFVLTYSQIAADVTQGLTATGKVSTQGCAD
jgi:S1-C subfamily serine protease